MKELLTKLYGHLSKNILASLVAIMSLLIAGYWYKDYKEHQDTLNNVLNEVKTGQTTIKTQMQNGFRASEDRDVQIKLEQTKMQGTIDIITKCLPQIKSDLKQYNQIFDAVREQQNIPKSESFVPNEITPKEPELQTLVPSVESKKKTDRVNEKLDRIINKLKRKQQRDARTTASP